MFYEEQADYLSLLPDFLHQFLEIGQIADCVNHEVDSLSTQIQTGVNNKSVGHCDEAGIARWEKILGISSPLNSSLQSRKEAAKAKLMTKPPINVQTIKGIIEAYMGLAVEVTVAGYQVDVKYRGTSRISDLAPLYATLYETIPANLLISINYLYLTWPELDAQKMTFAQLDSKSLTWNDFEKGEWI